MAMTKCKECGAEISTKADACPKCGAKQVGTSGCAKFALGVIVFFVFVSVLGQCSRSNAPAQQSASTVQQAPSPVPHDDLTHFNSASFEFRVGGGQNRPESGTVV